MGYKSNVMVLNIVFSYQGPSQYFLSSLGGWSSDGVTVSVELLNRLLEKGKEDPEVKETFVEMVL